MAAVLTPRTAHAPWNQPHDGTHDRPQGQRRSAGRHLRLVEGGRGAAGAAASASRPRSAPGPLLVLVGGVVLALVVALAALGAVQLLGADAAASGPASTAQPPTPVGVGASTSPAPAVVVVQPGDTLWAIARRLQPTGDVRPLVDRLAERAGGAAVAAGQRIDLSGVVD